METIKQIIVSLEAQKDYTKGRMEEYKQLGDTFKFMVNTLDGEIYGLTMAQRTVIESLPIEETGYRATDDIIKEILEESK